MKGLWNGISSMASWIKNKVSSFVSGIVDGFKGVKSGISSAVTKSKILDMPDITQKVNIVGDSDYSNVKFDYDNARQSTISDMISAMNASYSLIEGAKNNLSKGSKVDNNQGNLKTDNNININISVDNVNCNNRSDVEQMANDLAFLIKRKNIFR